MSIKEILSNIISGFSARKLPSISFNWWFVFGGLLILFLAGIFAILIYILKELKKYTHIHRAKSIGGSSFEITKPVSYHKEEPSKRKTKHLIPEVMIVKEEAKPEYKREEIKVEQRPIEKKEVKSLHQDMQSLQSAGFNVKPSVRERLEERQDLDKPSPDEIRTNVYKMLEKNRIDVGTSALKKTQQQKTEQTRPEIQAKRITASKSRQTMLNQLKEVYKKWEK